VAYVDGFVVPVPKQNIEAYKAMARLAGAIWREYGALAFVECLGDDVPYGELTSFPRAVQAGEDEVVAFSWIVYESREQRDAVNVKVMADPRLKESMKDMPFDAKRMIFGGFKTVVRCKPGFRGCIRLWLRQGRGSRSGARTAVLSCRRPWARAGGLNLRRRKDLR
jgi:uncharacterized protein YbaA (DUF1428 family)